MLLVELTSTEFAFPFCYLQTFGIIMTMGMRAMIERVSVLGANITVSAVLLLGAIGTGTHTRTLL